MFPPQLGDSFGVHQFKDSLLSLCPLDVFGTSVLVLQESQQELPKVDGVSCTQAKEKTTIQVVILIRSEAG